MKVYKGVWNISNKFPPLAPRLLPLRPLSLPLPLSEFRRVWTSFTSFDKFRRVSTSLGRHQTRYDEFGRVSTILTVQAKLFFLKEVPIASNISERILDVEYLSSEGEIRVKENHVTTLNDI